MEVVDSIAGIDRDSQDRPLEEQVLERVVVEQEPA
jgi:hypothetical protein